MEDYGGRGVCVLLCISLLPYLKVDKLQHTLRELDTNKSGLQAEVDVSKASLTVGFLSVFTCLSGHFISWVGLV